MSEYPELIKALRNCSSPWVGSCMDCPYYKGVSCKWQMMEDAADALEAAEKRVAELEAQLPKEGEWIIEPHGTYGQLRAFCSACGKHSGIGGIVSNQKKPYCPNCGAKMKTVTDCHTLEER